MRLGAFRVEKNGATRTETQPAQESQAPEAQNHHEQDADAAGGHNI